MLIEVERALPVDSPAYDLGLTEDEVSARWEQHWRDLRAKGSR